MSAFPVSQPWQLSESAVLPLPRLLRWSEQHQALLAWGAGLFLMVGLLVGLLVPAAGGRIIDKVLLIAIPATWVSILLFVTVAFWAAYGLVVESRLPFLIVQSVAPTGGMFTFLSLWTGAIWMKGSGGFWWAGDARQIAGLVLLFLYLALIAIPVVVSDRRRSDRVSAVLAVFGVAYVTLLFFVVEWWRVYEPVSSVGAMSSTLLPQAMVALMCVSLGLWLYSTLVALLRLRQIELERDSVPWGVG